MRSVSGEIPDAASDLIVGAGLSGLLAGRQLHDAGISVAILDKGRGVGGRCATRRFAGRRFDHGAQFFTARATAFIKLVQKWREASLVREWSHGFQAGGDSPGKGGNPRYCAVNGMNTIPKALAAGLPIYTRTRVVGAERTSEVWRVRTERGTTVQAKRLILTAPLPQSLALLPKDVRAELTERHPRIQEVVYEPCFAVLLLLDGPSALPQPGGMRLDTPDIAWIADNTMKGLNTGVSGLTIHTTCQFAEGRLESPHDQIANEIIAQSRRWLERKVTRRQVHRWLYSKPVSFVGEPYVALGNPPHLLLCGDCMLPPSRIEGAVLSGMAAAEALLKGGV